MALHNYVGPNSLIKILTNLKNWFSSHQGSWTTAVSQVVGDTSCTIADGKITASSIVDDYCETASGKRVNVKQITVTTGRAVLSFDALTEAATFKLWIR